MNVGLHLVCVILHVCAVVCVCGCFCGCSCFCGDDWVCFCGCEPGWFVHVFVHGAVFVVVFVHVYGYGFLFVFGIVFMGFVLCRNDFAGDLSGGGFEKVVFWEDGFVDKDFGGCDFGGMFFGGGGFVDEVSGECGFCGGTV